MSQKKPSKGPEKGTNNYLKYSQLGLQLFVTIGICGWLGYKMDQWWNNGKPLIIIIMIFAGTFGSLFQLYRSLPKE